MALFDRCAECRRCCHIDPGEPPLEITLTAEESGQFGHVCLERECRFLGATGCVLGDAKPFSCQLYPLAYKPRNQGFYYDVECPLMKDYVAQLADSQSEASAHLARMNQRIRELERSDADFLDRNFAVDKHYFRLRRLVPTTASVKTWLSWNFWFSR